MPLQEEHTMQFGLALSGGGTRAMVFHLGLLARLAAADQLENVSYISTVSGGSLCIGAVFGANNGVWPSSQEYRTQVVAKIRHNVISMSLAKEFIRRSLWPPHHLLFRQAKTLAAVLREGWNVRLNLSDLPERPRWVINATCYETGKRWRFERRRIADSGVNAEIKNPKFPVAEAISASAAVPLVIGPLKFEMRKFEWTEFEPGKGKFLEFDVAHLWDGALYDNLGLEAFENKPKNVDLVLVSDASIPLPQDKKFWSPIARYRRMYDISSTQSQYVRSRNFVKVSKETDNAESPEILGRYMKIGNSMEKIFKQAERDDEIEGLRSKCLLDEAIEEAKAHQTGLQSLSETQFDTLFRHGFEVADCTLYAHSKGEFKFLSFDAWNSSS